MEAMNARLDQRLVARRDCGNRRRSDSDGVQEMSTQTDALPPWAGVGQYDSPTRHGIDGLPFAYHDFCMSG
jgi:hypothetical protein